MSHRPTGKTRPARLVPVILCRRCLTLWVAFAAGAAPKPPANPKLKPGPPSARSDSLMLARNFISARNAARRKREPSVKESRSQADLLIWSAWRARPADLDERHT